MKIKALTTVLLGTLLLAAPMAQAETKSNWTKNCKDGTKQCVIGQTLMYSKKDKDGNEHKGKILGVHVQKAKDADGKAQSIMAIDAPLGVDLRAGLVIKVDEGKELHSKYLECQKFGCRSIIKLDEDLLKTLKAGSTLHVGFLPVGSKKTNALDVSLTGFTKAYNQL